MHAILHGNRGSRPLGASEGSPFAKYGGDTTAMLIVCNDGTLVAMDAGSGFWKTPFTLEKITGNQNGHRVHLFLSHYHDDHIMGMAQSDLLFDPTNKVTLYGPEFADANLRDVFNAKANRPQNPDLTKFYQAYLTFENLRNTTITSKQLSPHTTISWMPVPHGVEQSFAYRITEKGGASFSCISDTNHALEDDQKTPILNPDVIAFIKGSSALVYDCHYSDQDILSNPDFPLGMGHSSGEHGVRLCEAANVPVLVTHHHNPKNTDDAMDALTNRFKAYGKKHGVEVIAAQPNLTLNLNLTPKQMVRETKSMSTSPKRWARLEKIMKP